MTATKYSKYGNIWSVGKSEILTVNEVHSLANIAERGSEKVIPRGNDEMINAMCLRNVTVSSNRSHIRNFQTKEPRT